MKAWGGVLHCPSQFSPDLTDLSVNRLNNQQQHYLKSLAHSRKPVVIVGRNGLTTAVLKEIDAALSHHELIKVKINAEDRPAREKMIEQISQTLDAELVQQLGSIATLFRRNAESPGIQLP